MDGFYVAKLKKVEDGPRKQVEKKEAEPKPITKRDKRRLRQEERIRRKAIREGKAAPQVPVTEEQVKPNKATSTRSEPPMNKRKRM